MGRRAGREAARPFLAGIGLSLPHDPSPRKELENLRQ